MRTAEYSHTQSLCNHAALALTTPTPYTNPQVDNHRTYDTAFCHDASLLPDSVIHAVQEQALQDRPENSSKQRLIPKQ